jgi:predicted RNA polymerase sigma factor
MILTDARRPARTGPEGEPIPLDEQDRAPWDRDAIAGGTALITRAAAPRTTSTPGRDYLLQRVARLAGRPGDPG